MKKRKKLIKECLKDFDTGKEKKLADELQAKESVGIFGMM